MNIKEATKDQKLRAIAELDGWLDVKEYTYTYDYMGETGGYTCLQGREPNNLGYLSSLKLYTTSYDAILPVIQKQSIDTQYKVVQYLIDTHGINEYLCLFYATPEQLANALLVATGKFEL